MWMVLLLLMVMLILMMMMMMMRMVVVVQRMKRTVFQRFLGHTGPGTTGTTGHTLEHHIVVLPFRFTVRCARR
uniref:Putative secreted protein n=1 Tax=Anopheles darlingi TaxID=43151 RepID=A0A2M4D4H9_ANODA